LRSAYIGDQKTKPDYFELNPLPSLVTPLPNTVHTFFYFQGLRGAQCPPPYARGCHSPQISSRSSMKLICNCREWC